MRWHCVYPKPGMCPRSASDVPDVHHTGVLATQIRSGLNLWPKKASGGISYGVPYMVRHSRIPGIPGTRMTRAHCSIPGMEPVGTV